jgi:hypothetical protein
MVPPVRTTTSVAETDSTSPFRTLPSRKLDGIVYGRTKLIADARAGEVYPGLLPEGTSPNKPLFGELENVLTRRYSHELGSGSGINSIDLDAGTLRDRVHRDRNAFRRGERL